MYARLWRTAVTELQEAEEIAGYANTTYIYRPDNRGGIFLS